MKVPDEPKVDGKTRVKEHIAELTVRGELAADDDEDVGNTSVNTLNSLRSNGSSRISKKEKRAQQVSWKKRRRLAEAAERAENLKEMLTTKVGKSVDKFKGINERKKGWNEYNEKVIKPLTENLGGPKKKTSSNPFDLLGDDDAAGSDGAEMDVSD